MGITEKGRRGQERKGGEQRKIYSSIKTIKKCNGYVNSISVLGRLYDHHILVTTKDTF